MKYIVDRIEQEIAVCESEEKQMISVSVAQLPEGIKDGDIIESTESGFIFLEQETEERRQRIKNRMIRLFDRK